jgi:hypothetical protein
MYLAEGRPAHDGGGRGANLDDFPLEFLAPRNLGRETTTLNARLTQGFTVPPTVEDADPDRDPTGRLALALAHGYRAVRDQARAREWADRALQKSPMDAEARVFRARLAAEDGRHRSAAEDLLRTVSGRPCRMRPSRSQDLEPIMPPVHARSANRNSLRRSWRWPTR